MTGLWKFTSKSGRKRSLLALFILNSLSKNHMSGYDLLKSIAEKTDGSWVPSKGTIYPILKNLEDEKLIYVLRTEKRSKKIFDLTSKGRETLRNVKKSRKESEEKFFQLRNIFIDIFDEEKAGSKGLVFEIKKTIRDIDHAKEKKALKILEKCHNDLRRIE